uniref:Tetratricopeptide SHNi-TPR domain-containing protein n=1 Tax=Romanomermis culicivorax TaxID=13658 RepID=A0A915HNT3_ROMCU
MLQLMKTVGGLIKKAQNLLTEGRRFLVCRDYQNAVDILYEACNLFPQLYGEMAAECAEVYLLYGKSLVELERSNQTIFGGKNENAGDEGESEEEGDDDEADDQKTVEEKSEFDGVKESNENEPSEDKENVAVAAEASSGDENDEKKDEYQIQKLDKDGTSNGNGNRDEPGCSSIVEDNVEKTSAEVEETKKNDMLRLSEVRMTLGEVCALDEKYIEAVQEFTAALEILKEICAEDDRRLAEIYFQIGTASELNFNFEMAAENIKRAAKVLENRKRNFEEQLGTLTADDIDFSCKKEDIESEIKDLNEVLADIQQRLVDLNESQKNSDAIKQNLMELASKKCSVADETVGASIEKPNGHVASATDVSHLIRRPLKRASNGSSPENEAKRAKFVEEIAKNLDGNTKAENNCDQTKTNENDQKMSFEKSENSGLHSRIRSYTTWQNQPPLRDAFRMRPGRIQRTLPTIKLAGHVLKPRSTIFPERSAKA